MRTLELTYPWGTANLNVVERPDPTPGPGQVVVRMRAVSLNYRDFRLTEQGGYTTSSEDSPPVVPFSDGCGIIEAVGDGVTRVAVGDRVSTLFFPNWIDGRQTREKATGKMGSPGVPGAGRELALLSEHAVSRVPDYLTDHEVSTLACAALTAWRALFVDARLEPGDTVVLQGTGGVSIFGLQFAHAAGYRTIVTSSSDEKLARAKALGATELVNYRTTPDWHRVVREMTGGRGAEFIMEVGGAATLEQSLECIGMGGHIAVVGILSDKSAPAPTLSSLAMVDSSAKVQGLLVGSREMFEAMCRGMTLHQIRPVIDRVLPWTQAAHAIDEMAGGSHFGKIVLSFD
jgi:NADPH:quinone reductase-like Zn-dependent oxidoreductase